MSKGPQLFFDATENKTSYDCSRFLLTSLDNIHPLYAASAHCTSNLTAVAYSHDFPRGRSF